MYTPQFPIHYKESEVDLVDLQKQVELETAGRLDLVLGDSTEIYLCDLLL